MSERRFDKKNARWSSAAFDDLGMCDGIGTAC